MTSYFFCCSEGHQEQTQLIDWSLRESTSGGLNGLGRKLERVSRWEKARRHFFYALPARDGIDVRATCRGYDTAKAFTEASTASNNNSMNLE
jgi:hypothetical protein